MSKIAQVIVNRCCDCPKNLTDGEIGCMLKGRRDNRPTTTIPGWCPLPDFPNTPVEPDHPCKEGEFVKRTRESYGYEIRKIPVTHGACCTCQVCGFPTDGECLCDENTIVEACDIIAHQEVEIARLKTENHCIAVSRDEHIALNKRLIAEIGRLKTTIETQGKGCEDRWNALCEVKELVDKFLGES